MKELKTFLSILFLMTTATNVCSMRKSLRQKRQSAPEAGANENNLDAPMHEYVFRTSSRCRNGHLLCRDSSYCLEEVGLCDGTALCTDGSDENNSRCPKPPTTTLFISTTAPVTNTNNGEGGILLRFGSPMVIAFFALIIGLIVYVIVITACCTKQASKVSSAASMTSHGAKVHPGNELESGVYSITSSPAANIRSSNEVETSQ